MKKISYIICLTAILCSCNNELPIENVQELQTPKSKEDSEILSFKNSEEFLSTIENFDLDNPILTRASSSFVSAENIYEQENNENADNEYIGFLIPDEKYRNFFFFFLPVKGVSYIMRLKFVREINTLLLTVV